MNRFSLRQRLLWGPITYEDFMWLAEIFCEAVASYTGRPKVTIVLYKEIPSSVTAPESGVLEYIAEENEGKKLAEFDALKSVPKALFDLATNVQLSISPVQQIHPPSVTFGHLECKGLLEDHMIFYVQPESVGRIVEDRMKEKTSRWRFSLGDGFERCHYFSLS